jgi:hypothetical protein
MTIKFEKKTDLLGETLYYIYADNYCLKATQDENLAKDIYKQVLQRAKDGYPKTQLIEETTIPEPPKQ